VTVWIAHRHYEFFVLYLREIRHFALKFTLLKVSYRLFYIIIPRNDDLIRRAILQYESNYYARCWLVALSTIKNCSIANDNLSWNFDKLHYISGTTISIIVLFFRYPIHQLSKQFFKYEYYILILAFQSFLCKTYLWFHD